MDAFFASVEERDRPYLKDQPIVIGSDPKGGQGRGVVSTANYPARAYGIRSATPIRKAWEMSETARKKGLPSAVFISSGMRKYGEVSKKVMAVVAGHLEGTPTTLFDLPAATSEAQAGKSPPALEQVSVDECYLDLSFSGTFEKAEKIAQKIKKDINKKEKLTATIGIGPNKLIAKIASDFKKPDGLTVVRPEQIEDFLAPLLVSKIPGVGPKMNEKLQKLGIKTVADALKRFGMPQHQLSRGCSCKMNQQFSSIFGHDTHCPLLTVQQSSILQPESWCRGKWGKELYRKFRGESDSEVSVEHAPAKSISEQETLSEDTLQMKKLIPILEGIAGRVAARVSKEGFISFRTVALIVRFADFETVSRSRTLDSPVSGVKILTQHMTQMFFPFLDRQENPRKKKIRLLGVRVEKLK